MALIDNILSYYKLDGNSNDAADSNNGSDTSISYDAAYAKIGQGASFSGSSKIAVSNDGDFDDTVFSISLWVQPKWTASSLGYNACMASVRDGADTRWSIHIRDNYSAVDFWNGSGSGTWTYSFSKDTWYHIVFIYNSGTATLYVNDSSQGNVSHSVGSTTLKNFEIGYVENVGEGWSGYIDEVGYWDKVLSSDEVSELYNSGSGKQYPFGYTLVCGYGSLSLTGQNTGLTANRKLTCEQGSYSLTGQSTRIYRIYNLICEYGSYALTGINASLIAFRKLVCEYGSITLTGVSAVLLASRKLICDVGSYTLTGFNIFFSGAWAKILKHTSSYTNRTKNTNSYTNKNLNTSSWINKTKNG